MSAIFCQRHRSHFCPCAAPWVYRDLAASLAAWDERDGPARDPHRGEESAAEETQPLRLFGEEVGA